ncbi:MULTISPECIES: nitroreductase [unclassified Acinetobacter]|uniref:nitroreductase family protein n=1 Tax=unclassified Acinetobacter TaxID=196816 RepID=UPI0035B79139
MSDLLQHALQIVENNIHERQSVGALQLPAPSSEQVHQAIAAAITAPDHHRLHPWRFAVVQDEQRQQLGQVMHDCLAADGEQDLATLQKVLQHPLRAPMLIIATMKYQAHEKVPRDEQILSCGAAIQNLLLILQAQGFASIWRSGAITQSKHFKQWLGLAEQDEITGMIYVGTAKKDIADREPLSVNDFIFTPNFNSI